MNGEEQFNNLNYRFHNKGLFERFHSFLSGFFCGTRDAKHILLSVLTYKYKRRLSLHMMISKQVVLFLNWLLSALFMTLCTSAHFTFGYRQDPWCVNDADTLQDSVGQMHTLESEKVSSKFSIFQTDI